MAARRNHEFYELSEIRPGSHSSQATANLRVTTSDPHIAPFSLKQFWSQHVSCVVDFDKCRDHLAVERTFLAYLRTALMAAMTGTLVAQLFVLEDQDSGFGYTNVGRPLATFCYAFAMCTVIMGTSRAWRLQHAMIRGKALTGGFEIIVLAGVSFVLIVVFTGFLIALDVIKRTTSRSETGG
ncbi:conserved hypothetical protein [Verticillium alfalfae VaMs.102]|uniref:DUF202 domain-containing protein n=1 Tax=Verticillium alfalfae (strain VaMs.102 / ATCC MYA-4576 / FGSC 10136) TaxID=526221 RepID=C9SHD1_VERA1|nr:conserved hypothetical protein [Verticillium alfalfae VaMs.102]EEY17725.1 conserved hypothetical protein [Verticillium alfalfae VaMs.102]